METIKSYTDIEQSKKLAEILPLDSADMYYGYGKDKADFIKTRMASVTSAVLEIDLPRKWSLFLY